MGGQGLEEGDCHQHEEPGGDVGDHERGQGEPEGKGDRKPWIESGECSHAEREEHARGEADQPYVRTATPGRGVRDLPATMTSRRRPPPESRQGGHSRRNPRCRSFDLRVAE